jgi:hypothetical protein
VSQQIVRDGAGDYYVEYVKYRETIPATMQSSTEAEDVRRSSKG